MRWMVGLMMVFALHLACTAAKAEEPPGLQQAIAPGVSGPELGPGLSLDAAVRLALELNPSISVAARAVDSARASLTGAKRPPSPEIYVAPYGQIDDVQVGVSQQLEMNTRGARIGAARAALRSAEWDLEAARREVVFRVRTAYVDALEAQAALELQNTALDLIRQVLASARRSFELGNVPRSHVVRARVEEATAHQQVTEAEADFQVRKAALNAAIGRRADTPLTLADPLVFKPVAVSVGRPAEDVLAQRPEVKSAEAQVEAAAGDVAVARREQHPDVLVQAGRAAFGGVGENTVGVGFTLPFLDWGRRKAEIARAEAEMNGQRARREQTVNDVLLEVEEARRRLGAARQAVGTYQKGILADAEELMRMAQTGYEEGAMNYLEVLDARRTLTETRAASFRAVAEYQRSLAALQRAVGEYGGPQDASGRAKDDENE